MNYDGFVVPEGVDLLTLRLCRAIVGCHCNEFFPVANAPLLPLVEHYETHANAMQRDLRVLECR